LRQSHSSEPIRSRGASGRTKVLAPVWSPDSTKLLLDKIDRNNQPSGWIVNLEGSGLLKLADTPQPLHLGLA
jgi:hypothetical protein